MKFLRSVFVALLVAGCATDIRVGSDYDSNTDFSAYGSFIWEETEPTETGDPRLDNNPFFDARVRGAVERELGVRGFDKFSMGGADLLVHYHMFVEQKDTVNIALQGWDLDRRRGYRIFDRSVTGDVYINEYDQGTLLIDIADAENKYIIWRGWARLDVTDALNDREVLDRRVRQAVEKIVALFPV